MGLGGWKDVPYHRLQTSGIKSDMVFERINIYETGSH